MNVTRARSVACLILPLKYLQTYAIKGLLAALRLLDQVEQLVKDTPPVDNKSSRFGNPAFKDFYDKVSSVSWIAL